MKKWLGICAATLVHVATASAQALDVLPFVRQVQYADIEISPTGDYLALIVKAEDKSYPYKTELRVMDLRKKEYTSSLRFPGPLSVAEVEWLNAERLMIVAAKREGGEEEVKEDPNIVAVNFDGSKQMTIFGPDAGKGARQGLTATEEYASMRILRRDTGNPEQIYIAKYPWRTSHDEEIRPSVAMLNIYNGRQTATNKIDIKDATLTIDQHGAVRFAEHQSFDGFHEAWYRDTADGDWKKLFRRGNSAGSWAPLTFDRQNKRVLVADNSETELTGLAWYDPESGKLEDVYRPSKADIGRFFWTADGREIFAFVAHEPKPVVHFLNRDLPEASILALVAGAFPQRQIRITSYTADGKKAIAVVSSDKQPETFLLVDGVTKKAQVLGEAAPWMKGIALAEMQPVEIKARDGLTLPSLLTVPAGKEAKNLPAVLFVHGGPYGMRDDWGYEPEVQMLAAAGYAVLQVNFRGSGGFGKSFQFDAYGKWGTSMQDDLTDATKWLIASGTADPKRVCIMGHSYGGYAAVWGMIREPELYRCGIGSMGVYDLTLMHEEGDIQKSKFGRHYLEQAIGSDEAALAARSPVNHVAAIKGELLLSHGEEDERVPVTHVERLIKALNKAGVPHQYLEFDGEAHGFASEANRTRFAKAVLAFLDKNIGH